MYIMSEFKNSRRWDISILFHDVCEHGRDCLAYADGDSWCENTMPQMFYVFFSSLSHHCILTGSGRFNPSLTCIFDQVEILFEFSYWKDRKRKACSHLRWRRNAAPNLQIDPVLFPSIRSVTETLTFVTVVVNHALWIFYAYIAWYAIHDYSVIGRGRMMIWVFKFWCIGTVKTGVAMSLWRFAYRNQSKSIVCLWIMPFGTMTGGNIISR